MLGVRHPIFQYAYYVDDLDAAAQRWVDLVDAGPFFVADHHRTDRFEYRGQPIEADVSYAFGYAGDCQIQLIEQHDDQPSIYTDMFERGGGGGLHHVATLVSDFEGELARLTGMGFDLACRLYADGVDAAYIDTRPAIGCFLEIHGDPPHIIDTFARWKRAHDGWDGSDPIRRRPRTDPDR